MNLTSDNFLNPSPFCIIGDMNGRVGVESEFLSTNFLNDSTQLPTRTILETARNNCDKVKCHIGDKIIHLCKYANS